MLNVESLSVFHRQHRLIGPVSFEILAGRSLTIMGETGAGKSLIAGAIMGTLPPGLQCTGSIRLADRQIDTLDARSRRRLWGRQLAILPQEPWRSLDPLMRSFAQVLETHRYVSNHSHQNAKARTEHQFKAFDLTDARYKRPGQLSGGMGQRVSFCATIAGEAPVLLADEPTKGLDSDRIDTVIQHLQDIPAKGGVLILITHDVGVAQRIGGAVIIMRDGQVVETGNSDTILQSPEHAYTQQLIDADPAKWNRQASVSGHEKILTLNCLEAGYHGKAITTPVDLTVVKGSRTAITGPSGIGKSTLLDTIAGLIKPVSGSIEKNTHFNSTDIQKVYQDPPAAFAPVITLKQSLLDVAKLHGVPWQTVIALLERLGVCEELLDRKPDAVSGGELQRIAIARALTVKPRILLADEPTSRLDPVTQMQTMQLLAEVASDHHTAILLVTHDHAIATQWADNTITLRDVS